MSSALQAVGDKFESQTDFTPTHRTPGGFLIMNCPDTEISLEPVEVEGERAVFKPECMEVDRSYPFQFLGENLVAVKRAGGAVDFYHLG